MVKRSACLWNPHVTHLKQLNAKKIKTLVDRNNEQSMHSFGSEKFRPFKTVVF